MAEAEWEPNGEVKSGRRTVNGKATRIIYRADLAALHEEEFSGGSICGRKARSQAAPTAYSREQEADGTPQAHKEQEE